MGVRVKGHGLRSEGAAYVVDKDGHISRTRYNTTGGLGRALCECGEMSPITNSSTTRKAWHRQHKAGMAS
jgi:hypothetical protein